MEVVLEWLRWWYVYVRYVLALDFVAKLVLV